MTREVKNYLDEIKDKNKGEYFLFARFYYKPSSVLGSDKEVNSNCYYKDGNITDLILNKDFFELLNICILDYEFISRTNYILLKRIQFILIDSFVISFDIKSLKKNSNFKWTKDIKNLKEKVKSVNSGEIKTLYNFYNELLSIAYDTEVAPLINKEILLDILVDDDYDSPNCFLNTHKGQENESFLLVCDNTFLDIVETLLKKDLLRKTIDNIISILTIGINIYSGNGNYSSKIYELKEDERKNFDYVKALFLISELKEKRKNIKVINFNDYIERKNSFE